MKLTKHNGRAGKNGVFNPKHNDRSFDVSHSEHIDEERAAHNIYWDCYNGYRQLSEKNSDEIEMASTFEEVEQLYYHNRYSDYTDGQNERNAKSRHTERNRTTDEILKNKKTCPEETLLQIGKMEEHASAETLFLIATEFFAEFEQRFGSHVHILDWALHIDEKTPHIHERHVFDCENQYGELCPQQEKALEALGFELPEPDKKSGRHNNRKMIFDATCRALLFEICKKHGLHLDEEPEYGGRKHLEKQDFVLAKQKEELTKQSSQIQSQENFIQSQKKSIQSQSEVMYQQRKALQSQQSQIEEQDAAIQEKEEKLDELILKIDDVEALIDEVSDIAYDKAVEVVTDKVRVETHKHDMKLVEQSKAWVLSPERKASQKEKEYAAARLDGVITKIKNSMQTALKAIQSTLMKSEVKKISTEQISQKARSSILDKLHKKQADVARREAEKRKNQPNKKYDIEI
ncbi:MAG: serine/arginine repetitive matrix protein 2 [Lachnospiraceae bacterium]